MGRKHAKFCGLGVWVLKEYTLLGIVKASTVAVAFVNISAGNFFIYVNKLATKFT